MNLKVQKCLEQDPFLIESHHSKKIGDYKYLINSLDSLYLTLEFLMESSDIYKKSLSLEDEKFILGKNYIISCYAPCSFDINYKCFKKFYNRISSAPRHNLFFNILKNICEGNKCSLIHDIYVKSESDSEYFYSIDIEKLVKDFEL